MSGIIASCGRCGVAIAIDSEGDWRICPKCYEESREAFEAIDRTNLEENQREEDSR